MQIPDQIDKFLFSIVDAVVNIFDRLLYLVMSSQAVWIALVSESVI